jgi:uncharacterized membrane protein
MSDLLRRAVEGVVAAFFGAFIVMLLMFFWSEIAWHFVYFAAVACGITGFFVGERFLDWLGELFQRVW